MPQPPRSRTFPGRVLFLTEDPDLLNAQLARGERLAFDSDRALLDNISTDEVIPSWACYYYDERLGRYCLVGLRGGLIAPGAVIRGGFDVVVSGRSKGCGSSRETAPYSELSAGVKLVVARSFEKIYLQNAQNIGLLTSTDFGLLDRISGGEAIDIEEFTRGLDSISADIVRAGGLFAYNEGRLRGEERCTPEATPARPMTICEKILAQHAVVDARDGRIGVPAVRPGRAFFARADVRFTHDYVTAMVEALFVQGFEPGAGIADPGSVLAFRDHLTFLDSVMSEAHRELGLAEQAASLATVQESFARRHGIKLYGEVHADGALTGSEAICHNKILEAVALPGQLVIGTDSHTCTAGALGCLAFGVGASDMANALRTRDVRVRVPGTVRLELTGKQGDTTTAKDVMLHVLSQPFFRTGEAIGAVLEFTGEITARMSLDERATLTNMAVEAGGFTGIVEADEVVVKFLEAARGVSPEVSRALIVRSDQDAAYLARFTVDVGSISPMVATPGDPRNGVPLKLLKERVAIQIAYGGSCTGGKKADMDMYARVLGAAVKQGRRVAVGVALYLQFGSQEIRRYAEQRGYSEIFKQAGATLLGPSCGACIKAGPGASVSPDEVTVSAQNRNYSGRSGPGKVYLASPLVVAASAIEGRLASPEGVLSGLRQ